MENICITVVFTHLFIPLVMEPTFLASSIHGFTHVHLWHILNRKCTFDRLNYRQCALIVFNHRALYLRTRQSKSLYFILEAFTADNRTTGYPFLSHCLRLICVSPTIQGLARGLPVGLTRKGQDENTAVAAHQKARTRTTFFFDSSIKVFSKRGRLGAFLLKGACLGQLSIIDR